MSTLIALELSWMCSHWFPKPDILGAHLPGEILKGWGCLVWCIESLLFRETLNICEILPDCGKWGFWSYCVMCLSYPPPWGPFILCCGEALQLVFNSFSKSSVNLSSRSLFLLWGEVSSGSSFTTILNHLQNEKCHIIVD